MKLYMKQKVFSFRDKFTIKDEYGNDRYYAQGELFSWGHKLHICNAYNQEIAFVKQKILTWLPKFEVYLDGRLVTEVKKDFTFFKPKYTLTGLSWVVSGDYWAHNYTISDNGYPIVTISKAWFSWGDSYAIDIRDGVDERLAIAVVLAIDCVLEAAQRSSN